MYGPIIGSRDKILGSGDSCYHAYLVPWVPIFGLFSLWRHATSVKMNGCIMKLNQFFVWIFSIDCYLNWPTLDLYFLRWKNEKMIPRKKLRLDPYFLSQGPTKAENNRSLLSWTFISLTKRSKPTKQEQSECGEPTGVDEPGRAEQHERESREGGARV